MHTPTHMHTHTHTHSTTNWFSQTYRNISTSKHSTNLVVILIIINHCDCVTDIGETLSECPLATDEDRTLGVVEDVVADAAEDRTSHLAESAWSRHYHNGLLLDGSLHQQLSRFVAEHGTYAAWNLLTHTCGCRQAKCDDSVGCHMIHICVIWYISDSVSLTHTHDSHIYTPDSLSLSHTHTHHTQLTCTHTHAHTHTHMHTQLTCTHTHTQLTRTHTHTHAHTHN